MSTTAPADAREALDMVRAGLGYLAAADATQLPAETQAGCLRELEQDAAALTAARAGFLAAFTAGKGPAGSDIHHLVPWSEGGKTSIDDLKMFCKFHQCATRRCCSDPFSGYRMGVRGLRRLAVAAAG